MIGWDDIVDSIRLDKVLDELGINVTSVIRGEHWASCQLPTHPSADAKPSFSINEDTLLWNCFTCGEGGILPTLVAQLMHYENEEGESAFQKGIEWLLPFSDADVESDEGFQEQLERYLERASAKPKRSRSTPLPYFNPTALNRIDLCPVELLEKWHIYSEGTVQFFGIRYDEERRRKETDYYGPCIIMPHWFKGELVGYQERWLDVDRPKWVPKYTNSDEFPKALTLFAYDEALRHAKDGASVTVVEAAFTVARLWEYGRASAGTFGASVTNEQCNLLATFSDRGGIILSRDEDPDYRNEKGRLVKGAGIKNYGDNIDRLSYRLPVWTLPPIAKAKGDLADLDDAEVDTQYSGMTPVFRVPSNT